MNDIVALPPGISVFERGWLSSNNILLQGGGQAVLVDSGYATHAGQTLALVRRALGTKPLDLLANTHLHSDHCGGNAELQGAYAEMRTLIPPGHAAAVANWDTAALTYVATGQTCERFRFDTVMRPGSDLQLGGATWQVHAAPGHDPHSVILFQPEWRVLISADALWENGFGIVFPELEGEDGFDEVAETLDLVERLRPTCVIPGHGRVFGEHSVPAALAVARSRLAGFTGDPTRHARHAAKVLLKFKLLELQEARWTDLINWARQTPYFQLLNARYFDGEESGAWLLSLARELVKSGAARMSGEMIHNA